MSIEDFRTKLQAYRRAAGITQKAIAREMGLTPTVLSHKLNESDGLRLTHPEVKSIVKLLARWGAISAQSEAIDLLETMKLKVSAFTPEEWSAPPLGDLEADTDEHDAGRGGSRTASTTPSIQSIAAPKNHNLPAPVTSLIGREATVEELRARFLEPDVRLITLAGPGGVGKTRLAIEVGRRLVDDFADGVTFVPLAALTDSALVASEIVHTLKIRENDFDTPLDALTIMLPGQKRLLILDNFEQLTAAAPLISDLLSVAPGLKVMVTSRAVLRLYGEHLYWVTPLPLPTAPAAPVSELAASPAVALFTARARAARPDFQLTDGNASAVASICERLDGMPLALELAAARSRFFAPVSILERLEQGLPFLADRSADLPARQQRLDDAIRWSFDLLDAGEKRLFTCVSLFTGGFTVEAAEAVASNIPDVLDMLSSLLDKSLINQREDAAGQVRFSMLATLREFARDRLADDDPVFTCMTGYFIDLAERANAELSGARQSEFLDLLDAEHDNLRAALSLLLARQPGDALRLSAALWYFWLRRGYLSEGRRWLNATLNVAPDDEANQIMRAKVLYGAGSLADYQGEQESSLSYLETALVLYRAASDLKGEAATLNALGNLAWDQSRLDDAQASYQESIRISREIQEKRLAASALSNLGSVLWQLDRLDEAERMLSESLTLNREIGNKSGIAVALNNLGNLVLKLAQYERANALYAEALALDRESGDLQQISGTLLNIGVVAMNWREYERARSLYSEALAIRRQVGFQWGIGSAAINLGSALTALGSTGEAIALLNEGWTIMREIGDQGKIALARENLGVALLQLGDTDGALEHHRATLAISRVQENQHDIAQSLSCIAAVYAAQGDIPLAARLWGFASVVEAANVIRLLPADVDRFQPYLDAARTKDPVAFDAWFEAGKALDMETAVRLAEGKR